MHIILIKIIISQKILLFGGPAPRDPPLCAFLIRGDEKLDYISTTHTANKSKWNDVTNYLH